MRLHTGKQFPPRSAFNPLRGLTLARVVRYLEEYEQGLYSDVTWLFRHVEKREAVVRSIKERRQAALRKLEWTIEATAEGQRDNADKVLAQEQEAAAREAFGRIDNLRQAWTWFGMAAFRGFAHLEKWYDQLWRVTHLEPVDQWYFVRNYPSTQWLYDRHAQNGRRGVPVTTRGPMADFLVREIEDPIGFVAAIEYVRKNVGIRDWDAFNSMFGVPNVVAEPGPEASGAQEEVDSVQAKLQQMVSNGRLTLPKGWTVKMLGGAAGENTPFERRADYTDKMVVLAGTGGKLTMLSEATGIGSGATPAHEQVFADIAAAEAAEISEIFDKGIKEPELAHLFPGQPHLVEFRIRPSVQTDPKENADLMWKTKLGGWKVSQSDAERMIGVKLTEVVDETGLGADGFAGFAANRTAKQDRDVDGAVRLVEAAIRADMADVVQEVIDALEKPNGEREAALARLEAKLPDILADLNRDPSAAEAFEKALADGFEAGMRGQ